MPSDPSPATDDQQVGLGVLLGLLHDADSWRPQTVSGTYRIWRHEGRLREAFQADAEAEGRHGGRATTRLRAGGTAVPQPEEREETVAFWQQDKRVRVEHHGGPRDGRYSVADGPVWWTWLGRQGAISNQGDPDITGNVGDELALMFNPAPLLSALRFSVIGTSRVADRASITANAVPRPPDPHQPGFPLHQLGSGADLYTLEVDQQRGVLLAVTAIRENQPFQRLIATSLQFDEPIAAETFRFDPPDGEEVRSLGDLRRSQPVTLVQAQQLAPFTVLMPDYVPDTWQMRCTLHEASQRGPSPAELMLGYRSGDGHESVSISQLAATDRASHHYENMVNTSRWQTVTRDGTTVRTRPADFGQAQAYLERDGTFAFLVSDNLTNKQLATIAARLIPAPATSSI